MKYLFVCLSFYLLMLLFTQLIKEDQRLSETRMILTPLFLLESFRYSIISPPKKAIFIPFNIPTRKLVQFKMIMEAVSVAVES